MGFGEGYLNFQVFIQKLIIMPTYYDVDQNRLSGNPAWKSTRSLFSSPVRISQLSVILINLFSINHCRYLYDQFTTGHSTEPTEVVIYLFAISAATYALSAWYTEETNLDDWTLSISRILTYGNVKYNRWPSSRRLANFHELVAYGVSIGLLFLVLGGIAFPWIRPYDPISTMLKDLLPEMARKIVTSCSYCFILSFGGMSMLCFMLMTMTVCHVMEHATANNLKISHGKSLESEPNWLDSTVIFPIEKALLLSLEKFI